MPHSHSLADSKDLAYVQCCGMLAPRVQTTTWRWPLSVKAGIVQTMSLMTYILETQFASLSERLAVEEKEFSGTLHCRMCTLNTGHVLLLISLTDILHSILEENVSQLRIWSFFSQDHFKKSSWKSHSHTSYHTVDCEVNELSSNIIIKLALPTPWSHTGGLKA